MKVKDCAVQIRGVSYKPTDLHSKLNDNSVTLFRANNIKDGEIIFDDVLYVDKKCVSDEQYLKKGDILICASSGSKALVGKAAQIDFNGEYTFGAFCKAVRPNKNDDAILGVFFQSHAYRRMISALSQGVNINNIRNEHIDNLELPFFTVEVKQKFINQIQIVTKSIACCQHLLQKLDTLVKSRFIEMFGDPVTNPHGWEKVPLSDLAELKIGPFGTMLHKEDYITGGHPLVNPSHIHEGNIVIDEKLTISDKKYEELSAYHLVDNDVVMGRRGEMGRCAVVKSSGLLCGTGSMIIRSFGEVRADFLQKIISFPTFKKTIEDMAVGQTMPNLNVQIISRFKIIKPPAEVQNVYYDFVAQVDKSKLVLQKLLEKQELLRAALMQEYFG